MFVLLVLQTDNQALREAMEKVAHFCPADSFMHKSEVSVDEPAEHRPTAERIGALKERRMVEVEALLQSLQTSTEERARTLKMARQARRNEDM